MSGWKIVTAIVLCLVAGEGCSDKKRVPGGILPLDKMEQVMWDMAQADQYASLYLTKDSVQDDKKSETMRLYEEVFRLHEVTREQFRASYRYYLGHPALNQELFDSVMARGVRARTEMYDRPSTYRPPVMPRPNVVPGRPGVPNPARPGILPVGRPADAMQRAQEAMMRRQDSLRRAMHLKRDTTRGRP